MTANEVASRKAPKSCCQESALTQDAAFCGQCGRPLLRCLAFQTCSSLVDKDGYCRNCFDLKLVHSNDSFSNSGTSVVVPLVLHNHSPAGRSIHIAGVWFRVGKAVWEPLSLAWDSLAAGDQKPITLTVDQLSRPGSHSLEVVLAASSRWDWREETFAFCGSIDIQVDDKKEMVIHQTINYSTDSSQSGGTIYAPLRIENNQPLAESTSQQHSQKIILTRATTYELQFNLRGTPEKSRVTRTAKIIFENFSERDTPGPSGIGTSSGMLQFGRSRSKLQGGQNDVRTLVMAADGSVDELECRNISRRHFCLWIQNDRLMVKAISSLGIHLDGRHLPIGNAAVINDGSSLSPFQSVSGRFELEFHFRQQHDEITSVVIRKTIKCR